MSLWLIGLALVLYYALLSQLSHWAIQQDRLQLALFANISLLNLSPWRADLWVRTGNLCGDLGHWHYAERLFDGVLRWFPEHIDARLGRGTAYLAQGRPQHAQADFQQAYRLRRGPLLILPPPEMLPLSESPQTAKLQHDLAQWRWRLDQGDLDQAWENECLRYQQALAGEKLALTSYQRPLKGIEMPRLAHLLANTIPMQTYREQGLVWQDDFLTAEACSAVYRQLLHHGAWHHVHQGGYLGAYLDDGLHDDWLFQLAAELSKRYPDDIGSLKLVYAWAFHCQPGAQGIYLHHDSAVLNLNLWLTPDAAHHNPGGGGLCIYRKEPPKHWDLERYQVTQQQMQAFVAESPREVVPYRCNRAVLFNSRLFHASEPFEFGQRYPEWRLNLTLLFGHQPLRYHPKRVLSQNAPNCV